MIITSFHSTIIIHASLGFRYRQLQPLNRKCAYINHRSHPSVTSTRTFADGARSSTVYHHHFSRDHIAPRRFDSKLYIGIDSINHQP